MKESTARSIPDLVKAGIRRALVSLAYRTGTDLLPREPLIPPPWLHCVGHGDYTSTGEEFFRYFTELAGLKPNGHVLDVGCGTGRMARPLTNYLTEGSYDGLDIVNESIDWCQEAYTRSFPNFQFHFTDIYNKVYNPGGTCKASEYRFPFADSSFDLVFLTSVFTHMMPADLENYLREIVRVMKPGGRCLITYFLLNDGSLKLIDAGVSGIAFEHDLNGCRVKSLDVPEAAVAYTEDRIRDLYAKGGLAISEPVRYGIWCGRENGLSFQDIVIANKVVS
jgi:SAM-dependent methyltransferase